VICILISGIVNIYLSIFASGGWITRAGFFALEVSTQIIDGSTMIPARALAEALGAKVIWDEDHQTVVIENEKYRHIQRKRAAISEQDAVGLAADAQWLCF
jgi:hypothetical protein